MNKTSTFDFMGIQLRVVLIDGNPWFVAQDICRALDVAVRADGSINTSMATAKLDASEKLNLPYQEAKSIGLKETASRAYGVTLISESGIYRMVMRCDKWEARAFQDWVTKVVLPAIRKDGAYIKDEEKVATGEMSEDELILKAVGILQKKVERLTAERDDAVKKLNTMDVGVYCREILNRYPSHSLSVRLGQRAVFVSEQHGHKVEKTLRILSTGRDVYVNVYEKEALDKAAIMLGLI